MILTIIVSIINSKCIYMMLVCTSIRTLKTNKKVLIEHSIQTLWRLNPFHKHNAIIIISIVALKHFNVYYSVLPSPVHEFHNVNDLCWRASILTRTNKLIGICHSTNDDCILLICKHMLNYSLTGCAALTLSKMKWALTHNMWKMMKIPI